MTIILNILCFAIGFLISWNLVKGKLGIKQLSETCISLALTFLFVYFCAKYFGTGFALLPGQEGLKEPEVAMQVSLILIKIALVLFPICYVFEWWYYRKHPNIDPYTGKKKEPSDGDDF